MELMPPSKAPVWGRAPLRISLAYALIASLSAAVLDWLISRAPHTYGFHFTFAKDALFILVTAVLLYFFIVHELRALRESYLALEQERIFIHSLVQNLAEGIVATDASGTITVTNRTADELMNPAQLLVNPGSGPSPFLNPDGTCLRHDQNPIQRSLRGETVNNLDLKLFSSKSGIRSVLANANPISTGDGSPAGAVMTLLDVTENRRFAYQALHDALTGLPNRVLFMDRLEQALKARSRKPFLLAVLYLDLDLFKPVNDRLGHAAGDTLLRAVGERLQGCLRPGDTLARFGGDEFVFLLGDLDEAPEAERVAARVIELLERPFQLEGSRANISGSIGGVFPGPGVSAQELVEQADAAMYEAKRAGRGRFLMVYPVPMAPNHEIPS